jgi:hypothetical protein
VPYTPDHDIRAQVSSSNGWTYPFGENFYNDIRAQELKCIADRNREWKYDGATNTGSCTKNSFTPYVPFVVENDIRAQKSVNATDSTLTQAFTANWTYPFGQNSYNDIRSQELKCLGNRNFEWKYDGASNTGSCTKNSLTPYVPYTPENDIRAQKDFNSTLGQVAGPNGWTYPFGQNSYNDIRVQELKCLADRNMEWSYNGATNTGSCTKNSYNPYAPVTLENDIRAQKVNASNSTLGQVATTNGWTYPFGHDFYNDIRAQELKCIADRNREWKYDGATNTGSCTKNSYSPYVPFVVENDIRAQKNGTAPAVKK